MPLHSKTQGEGPPLILIHGLFGSLENLGGIARELSKSHTVYSVDLPNHGRSPHVSDMSLNMMADQVSDWMAQEGLNQAAFVGHSLGGKVAMEVALHDASRVSKLAVMDIAPAHYLPHHNQVFDGLLAVDIEQLSSRQEADAIIGEHVPEVAIRSFLLKNIQRHSNGSFSWRMNLSVIHEHYPRLIQGNVTGKQYAGDVLFLRGGASDYIGEQHRDEILSRFPRAKVKTVANVGHWLHAEKPSLISKLLEKFLIES